MFLLFITISLIWIAIIIIGVLIKTLAWLAITGIVLLILTAVTAIVQAARGA